jgi:hypothetical protein
LAFDKPNRDDYLPEMKARSSLLWLALTALVTTTVTACTSEEARIERARQALAQEDAELLGQEIFDLVDQAAGYQSSHSGRRPRSLRIMNGHAVSRCGGDAGLLEQITLEGAFRLECSLVNGTGIELTVGSPST